MNDDAVCKGCWQLANNCGRCPRCLETAHEAVALIRRFLDENGRLRDENAALLARVGVWRGLGR
jgi:predicted amidophosphoribosyltransferase